MLNHYPKQVQIKPGPHPITRPNHHPSPKSPFASLIIHAREKKSATSIYYTFPQNITSQTNSPQPPKQIQHIPHPPSVLSPPLSPILLLQPPSCSLSISTRYLISRLAHHNPKIGAKNAMKG